MIKLIIIPACIFIFLTILFTNCKSNLSSDAERMKQDSLQKAATSPKVSNEYSKYQITPPDPDYTGDYIDKYSNGVIKFTGFFRFGERHGQWMAFYENGIKWSECFYDKGKRHGSSMVFYPDGKLQYSGWFKNDLKDSLWFFYDNAGKEIDKHAYRNGEETGLVN